MLFSKSAVVKGSVCIALAMAAGTADRANAAIIVDLAPGSAESSASTTSGVTLSNPSDPAGLTFNITFTPTTVDLAGTVLLMELGGTSNGTGLYLINGVPSFIGKQNLNNSTNHNAPDDADVTDGNFNVDHSGGALLSGTEYTIAAILRISDTTPYVTTGLELAVANAGVIVHDVYSVTDTSTDGANWSGNDTYNVKIAPGTGNMGGLGGEVAGTDFGVYDANAVDSLSGTVSEAYYWNLEGNVIPEPASAGLLGIGVGLLALRRRRSGQQLS